VDEDTKHPLQNWTLHLDNVIYQAKWDDEKKTKVSSLVLIG
jgi:hypothetical protein